MRLEVEHRWLLDAFLPNEQAILSFSWLKTVERHGFQ